MKKIFLFLLFLYFISCSSSNLVKDDNLNNLDFNDAISTHMRKDKKIVNFFDGYVTLNSIYVSPKLLNRILKELDKKNILLKNILLENIKNDSINFIVGFYTPRNSWNDLDSQESIWNITLSGADKKVNNPNVNLLRNHSDIFDNLFGNDNKFYVYYLISFKKMNISNKITLTFSSIHLELKNIWEF